MAKHMEEMEFLQKYGSTEETICSADCTNTWKVGSVPQALKDATQCGFRGNRSTVDVIFCLRQFRNMEDGVYIQSRQNADLFNVAHFRAKTKTTRILMRELLFADDSALVAHSAEEMQKIVGAFSDASKKFGLKINIKKTEVLYQPNSTRTREADTMVDGNKLNCSGILLPWKHYMK